jgi:isochorismate synthase
VSVGESRSHVDPLAAVEAAARQARERRRPALAALRGALPATDLLAAFARWDAPDRFFFERPGDGLAIAGRGATRAIETSGAARFAVAAERTRTLFADLHVAGEATDATCGPLVVGGFAFDDGDATRWEGFPAARLVLPELSLVRRGGEAFATVVRAVAPDADAARECRMLREALARARGELARARAVAPDELAAAPAPDYRARADRPLADYRARVRCALRAIGAAALEKVVIARRVVLSRPGGFDAAPLLAALRETYPACTSFAVARPGGVFLGASPERLVRLAGRGVETAAVAGSAARGRNPQEDARLARELRESKKEQTEHAIVVRALREALAAHCDALRAPEAPRILQLDGIQHLETPISGVLRGGRSVLDLVGSLHPTPAVAGAPRAAAVRWIARQEGLDRGWYAGPIGFVNAQGGGEFVVALRSALLCGEEARLFAGAGIVEGSQPDAELRETRLKLRALLAPLLEI